LMVDMLIECGECVCGSRKLITMDAALQKRRRKFNAFKWRLVLRA
jgi:hypothetical protein